MKYLFSARQSSKLIVWRNMFFVAFLASILSFALSPGGIVAHAQEYELELTGKKGGRT